MKVAENRDASDDFVQYGSPAIKAALDGAQWPWPETPAYYDESAATSAEEDGPLPGCVDLAEWTGKTAPHRRFIVPGWIVRGSAGLLSGMEGVGKSLIAQQMATCAAIGRDFLGLPIEHVPAVYISCEDDIDEMWRRQESINAALGISMADVAIGLELVSLKGQIGNELGTFDAAGRLTPSLRYRQILRKCERLEAGLVFLDNAAHFFAGNENARHDVAAFLGLIEQLSLRIDGAVVLLAHPNKQHAQGNTQGNEYSGSTGWSAHVRNRLFLDYAKQVEGGAFVDDDDRVLRKSKANYGKRGEEITFRWHDWAFVTIEQIGEDQSREIARAAEAGHYNELFLTCLDTATKSKVPTSASSAASNYAPRVFAKMPAAQNAPVEALEQALQRLLGLERVRGDCELWRRPNRNWVIGLGRI